jgi:hypothetical protein
MEYGAVFEWANTIAFLIPGRLKQKTLRLHLPHDDWTKMIVNKKLKFGSTQFD